MGERGQWFVLTVAVLAAVPTGAQDPASAPAPDAVDLRLTFAAGTMNHRLLVYEVCTPRGCEYQSHLQWFKTEWDAAEGSADVMPERVVLASCPVAELTGEARIEQAHWESGRGDPELVVTVSPPVRDPVRQELRLRPGKPCDYEVERSDD